MSKKVSLITIFDNPNFGTYLQALALGLTIQKYGATVEIVHYERPGWHSNGLKDRALSKLSFMLPLICKILRKPAPLQQYECRKFVGRYMPITKAYYSYNELVKDPPKADVYLTGSDQVWNTTHNHGVDKSFYLGYAPKGSYKVAYAASIGMDNIPQQYQETTKQLLSQYSYISVREASNVDLLRSIGIDSELVLDPTLLFNKNDWSKISRAYVSPKPYILVYSVETEEIGREVSKVARGIANKTGMDVYCITYSGREGAIPDCDKYIIYATPDMFLSFMQGASFVVASSFHATAFAINFHKPFISVAPDRFSSRIDSLLNITGLKSRKINDSNDDYLHFVDENIDYNDVEDSLKPLRQKSLEFIKNKVASPSIK